MRVLLDAVHPAHVHFFGAIGDELVRRGHSAVIALRDRDVSIDLAAGRRLPSVSPSMSTASGRAGEQSMFSQGRELLARVRWLHGLIAQGSFEIILTRNPSGAIAARFAGVPSVFDTDDGREARLHFRLAHAAATVTTTPELLTDDLGQRHRRYRGLKTMAFLHPDRFAPRESVLAEYELGPDEPIVVVRFSSNKSSHDRGIRSIPFDLRAAIEAQASEAAHAVISVEGEGTFLRRFSGERTVVAPDDFLHLLAFSDLHVGDSGSVTMEAAALGVPTLRIADSRRSTITELARRYGLVEDFPLQARRTFERRFAEACTEIRTLRGAAVEEHRRLLSDSTDIVAWFIELAQDTASSRYLSGR